MQFASQQGRDDYQSRRWSAACFRGFRCADRCVPSGGDRVALRFYGRDFDCNRAREFESSVTVSLYEFIRVYIVTQLSDATWTVQSGPHVHP
jgi:hypothetical protein